MVKKAIAVDLDGTFLHSDQSFDEARFETFLNQWLDQGHEFILATGREEKLIDHLFANYLDRLNLVVNNGAVMRARFDSQSVAAYLSQTALGGLQAIIQKFHPTDSVLAFSDNHFYGIAGFGERDSGSMALLEASFGPIIWVDHLLDIEEAVTSVTANFGEQASEQVGEYVNATLGEIVHATTSGMGALDVLAKGVNKASGLEKLLTKLAIASEDLTVFGDGMNDVEMMQLAGQVFVMPNGDARLMDLGYQIARFDNNADGVLYEAERILAQEINN